MNRSDAEARVREAVSALQAGRASEAFALVRSVTDGGHVSAQIWAIQAEAAKRAGDWDAAEAASDRVIATEPNAILSLILKGDCRRRVEDRRAAARFYARAVELAEQANSALPPAIAAEVSRVAQVLDDAQAEYRAHLLGSLERQGLAVDRQSARFRYALSLMTGEAELYQQQPTMFYLPWLAQRPFFEREDFAWAAELEAETSAIRDELAALLQDDNAFAPYLVSDPENPPSDFHGLRDNPEWSSAHLYRDGVPVAANADRCPRTMAALAKLPLPDLGARAPAIMFSRLKPGARIPAHNGAINARLICHLPLVVPEACGFRVGSEMREWEVGKLLIFDDTIEHEAWNNSTEDRIVLIFDIWRPDIDELERAAIQTMFSVVDSY